MERPGGGAGWPAARARLRGTAPDPSALRTSRCCSDSSMARMTSIICPFAASDMEQTRPGRRRFSRDCALRRRLCQTSIVSLRVCTQHQRLRSRRCVSTPPPPQPISPWAYLLRRLPRSCPSASKRFRPASSSPPSPRPSLCTFFSSPPSLSILHHPSRPPASPPLPPSVARSRGRPLLTASHRSRLGKRKTNRPHTPSLSASSVWKQNTPSDILAAIWEDPRDRFRRAGLKAGFQCWGCWIEERPPARVGLSHTSSESLRWSGGLVHLDHTHTHTRTS